jgi:NAD+ synthase (glutamine-hydrolysing)
MNPICFAIAQMNPTVGDYAANTDKIIDWIRQAEHKSADLIVFPELALCGYPVWDLATRKSFIRTGLKYLDKIAAATKGFKVTVALGFIDEAKAGHRSLNSMAWISRGKIISKTAKRLLPTYDVFLEQIFFESGTESKAVALKGCKAGPLICEDLWDEHYTVKPIADLARQKPDFIVSISASPYYRGVAAVRDALVKRHVQKHKIPILYLNQVGGQDDLIFDGRSFFTDAKGRVLFRAPAFQEGLFFFKWNPKTTSHAVPQASYSDSPEEIYKALVLGVQDYCRKNNFDKAVIGLSGGIDSALVAALAVDALGKSAVTGVTMPGPHSSSGSWQDSEELARRLGIEFRTHSISDDYDFFMTRYTEDRKKAGVKASYKQINLAMENLQARLRGLKLMFISNDERRLVLTTGNKSELAMGYCTLYGDMAGGLAVIGDVYKTDVFRLAEYRNTISKVIPQKILTKAPSAELRPNQKDEDSLPPYEILDEVLFHYIEKNRDVNEISKLVKKISRERIAEIIRSVDRNEYKRRQTPPILRVTPKAWFGRRMPITNRFVD